MRGSVPARRWSGIPDLQESFILFVAALQTAAVFRNMENYRGA
jgi:hypothetical protein